MTDKDILKRLLELGVERLLEQNPDFSINPPTIVSSGNTVESSTAQAPLKEAVVEKPGKTDNPGEDAEWQRRFGGKQE